MTLNKSSTEANNWNIKTFDFLISRGWDVNYYWGHHGDILACVRRTLSPALPRIQTH